MPSLKDAFNTFRTGDIIRTGPSARRHMTMFIKAAEGPAGQPGFVHASESVMFEKPASYYQANTNICEPYEYFECPDAPLGKLAAQLGQGWIKTRYGSGPDPVEQGSSQKVAVVSRFGGMVSTGALADIPFELAALLRVVKWVAKAERGALLSENRGTTCAAFVAACYQTAAMKRFLEEAELLWNIEKGVELLGAAVESKGQARERRARELKPVIPAASQKTVKKGATDTPTKPADPHLYQGYASREHANRRLLDDSWGGSINDQWKKFYREFDKLSNYSESGRDPSNNISEIIPAPFFYDVKYINAPLLSESLSGSWSHRTYDKF